jgi:hypothetical protein
MTTTLSPPAHRAPLPRAWRRADIEQRGVPRYRHDDFQGIRTELRDGAGFVLVDGLLETSAEPAERLTQFGSQLGRLLAQNAKRETLVQIADFTDEDEFDDRGYRSPGELDPHTDPPPLIALLCLRPAREGGTNRLVSAETIRNSIRQEAPEALARLEAGFAFFLPDEQTRGAGRSREALPILLDGPGGLSCVYYRPFIERAAEVSGVALSADARAALDAFDRFANDPELQIAYTLEAGEMLILNNYRVLHARDDYADWPQKERRRCLLRLWLDADWLPDPPPAHAGRRDPMAALL